MKVDGSKKIRTIKYREETIAELPIGIDSEPLKQIDGNDYVGTFAYVINALNDFIAANVLSVKKNEMPDKCASCKYEDRFGGCYLLNCMRNDTPYEEFDEEWRSARKEGRRLKYCPSERSGGISVGTNYYAVKNRPTVCSPIHIGKSSYGDILAIKGSVNPQDEDYSPVAKMLYNILKVRYGEKEK